MQHDTARAVGGMYRLALTCEKMASYPRDGSPYAALYARSDELKAQLERPAVDSIAVFALSNAR